MGAFFKGWRRKAGCVALVLALLIAAAWIKSTTYTDLIRVWYGGTSVLGISVGEGRMSCFLFGETQHAQSRFAGQVGKFPDH